MKILFYFNFLKYVCILTHLSTLCVIVIIIRFIIQFLVHYRSKCSSRVA